jgi:hypothetical protein
VRRLATGEALALATAMATEAGGQDRFEEEQRIHAREPPRDENGLSAERRRQRGRESRLADGVERRRELETIESAWGERLERPPLSMPPPEHRGRNRATFPRRPDRARPAKSARSQTCSGGCASWARSRAVGKILREDGLSQEDRLVARSEAPAGRPGAARSVQTPTAATAARTPLTESRASTRRARRPEEAHRDPAERAVDREGGSNGRR